jgi:D-aminoacyl-tRNA deacylase
MRAIVQRCLSGSVTIDGQKVSEIGKGLVVLVGIHRGDTADDIDWLARKLANIRLWPDSADRPWRLNVQQIENGNMLMVSQFTLYGKLKGNRPGFSQAMEPLEAEQLYDKLRARTADYLAGAGGGAKLCDGKFGAQMTVAIENDGPVTLILDSNDK